MTVRSEIIAELPHLRAFGRHLTHNYHAAEDLVQRTIVRALEAEHQYQDGTRLRAWLFSIEVNIFRNDCRNGKREIRPNLEEDLEQLLDPDQDDRIHFAEVAREFARLPPLYREALIAIAVDGLTYQDAADRIGIPSGTIKSRVSRAREILAKKVNR